MLKGCKVADNRYRLKESLKIIFAHKAKTKKKDAPVEVDGEYIDYDEQKSRKIKLEADKLEDEKNLRRDNWAPIAEMESEWLRQFREVMELSQDAFDDLKSRFELTAEQIHEVDQAFAEHMNKIAEHR